MCNLQYNLGPCCACQKENSTVRNIICLDRKAPIPGKGWGCFVCGLPSDGAVAVLCDHCFEARAEIRFVCHGYPYEGRMPIQDLPFEPFEHDLAYHPESGPFWRRNHDPRFVSEIHY